MDVYFGSPCTFVKSVIPDDVSNDITKESHRELKIKEGSTVFRHPFTMILAGPTGSGKTFFVKDLLEKANIEPMPDRIVYLYKRWQPLYDLMRKSVKPKIEFIKGIPEDLDSDKFFDPKMNNVIVVDDLMSTAAKDPRIMDLFTEGSHHRNLSVLKIDQSLYPPGDKSCTMRRNAQYIVLFKLPGDKRQVMSLAQQMYPGKVNSFVNLFEKATHTPHSYLLIDLKQSTPEEERLKSKVFDEKETQMLGGKGSNDKELNAMPPPPGLPANSGMKRQLGGGTGGSENEHDNDGGDNQRDHREDKKYRSFMTDLLKNCMWFTKSDADNSNQSPEGWDLVLHNFIDHEDISFISNPLALTYLAHLTSKDEPSPYWWECNKNCGGKLRAFYVSKCPACKPTDIYPKLNTKAQTVICHGEDKLPFQTGWNDCLYVIELCNKKKHAFISDHKNCTGKNTKKRKYPEIEIDTTDFLDLV